MIVNMSLKSGWNQIETLTHFSDDHDPSGEWMGAMKYHRISAGIMGPFNEFDEANTTNFNTNVGMAYHLQHKRPADAEPYPEGTPRLYSDEEGKKLIPWVVR